MENKPSIAPNYKHYIKAPSLINLLENEDPDMALLPDHEITANAKPSSILWSVRSQLWQKIEEREAHFATFGKCDDLTIDEIRKGLCGRTTMEKYLKNPYKAAFLASPLRSFEAGKEDRVRSATARIQEILSLPMLDAEGLPDKGMAKLVFDAAKLVLDRDLGQTLQRTASISVNKTVLDKAQDMGSVDEDIKKLEAAIAGSPAISTQAPKKAGSGEETCLEAEISMDS